MPVPAEPKQEIVPEGQQVQQDYHNIGGEGEHNTLLTDVKMEALARKMKKDVKGYKEVDKQSSFLTVFAPSHSRPLGNVRYKPCYVSIGPCYWSFPDLLLEKQKLLHLKTLLRLSRPTTTKDLVELVNGMKHEILKCYDLEREQQREDFVEMLIYDGCYLILHYGAVNRNGQPQGHHDTPSNSSHQPSQTAPSTEQRGALGEQRVDQTGCWPVLPKLKLPRITGRGSSQTCVELTNVPNHGINGSGNSPAHNEQTNVHDEAKLDGEVEDHDNAALVQDAWYLLENQIPFFVVEKINKKLFRGVTEREIRHSFTTYARGILMAKNFYVSSEVSGQESEFYHLLHLLHTLIIKPMKTSTEPGANATQGGPWRRATDYVSDCNVRFVGQELVATTSAPHQSVLEVCIEGGKVKLPCLHIDDHTWTILHNLVALEKADPSLGSYVTAYCFFMSQLVGTAEDVHLLQKCDVIGPYCGHETVVAGFKELSSLIVLEVKDSKRNYLTPIWLELERRYKKRLYKICSLFRLTYWNFGKIDVLCAAIAGFLLLVAGLLSAVFQVLSYYNQGGSRT